MCEYCDMCCNECGHEDDCSRPTRLPQVDLTNVPPGSFLDFMINGDRRAEG
jgi:hypothetical protein